MTLSPLRPGDQIALVAPSSPFDTDKFNAAAEMLESNGYVLSPGRHIFSRREYLAGGESHRVEDLIQAITDPAISAIFCVRGGYGSGRLLEWLPFGNLKKIQKIFLGHSDITFLHLAFQSQMGWVTFHGPNLLDLSDVPVRLNNVLEALSGEADFSWTLGEDRILRHGMASGPVMGGNLTCLVHLLGTPFFPDLKGAILLMEDCTEALYRLDRCLTQLKHAGVLQKLGGLILGQFKDCDAPENIWRMVMEHVKAFSFPVICELPFGHGVENHVIPLGIPFSLNTYEHTLKILQSPFGN